MSIDTPFAYANRLLKVDLTTGDCEVLPLSLDYVSDYLGGRGLAARYLLDLLPPGVDPYSADNVAVLMTGPFTGTGVYACQKYEWVTKSPLTGTYLCSNCGGSLGVNLRKAGFDGLILTGQASRPTYLRIDPAGPLLLDAEEIWGKTVSETQEHLRAWTDPSAAVGCIGPAGEPPQSVRLASFFDGQRSAGRGGLGAVLGAKRLKAIVVVPGQSAAQVYDPGMLRNLLPELAKDIKRDRLSGDTMPSVGSLIWMDALALSGLLPTRNYQASLTYDEIRHRLDSQTFTEQIAEAATGDDADASCHRCPLRSAKL